MLYAVIREKGIVISKIENVWFFPSSHFPVYTVALLRLALVLSPLALLIHP